MLDIDAAVTAVEGIVEIHFNSIDNDHYLVQQEFLFWVLGERDDKVYGVTFGDVAEP